MNVTLLKALGALVPVLMLFSGSIVFFRRKTVGSFLQLPGAGCPLVVGSPIFSKHFTVTGAVKNALEELRATLLEEGPILDDTPLSASQRTS